MQQIPLAPIPSQKFTVTLADQACSILVQAKAEGVFFDMVANGTQVASTTLALNAVQLLACGYTAFPGQIIFLDTQGNSDPEWQGFGSRYLLLYISPDDMVVA